MQEPLTNSAATWIDYDLDGDLDLFVTGTSSNEVFSRFYRNDHNAGFIAAEALPVETSYRRVTAIDYDTDGDMDLAFALATLSGGATQLYQNNDGVFSPVDAGLPEAQATHWGDYDNDGDPDLLLARPLGGH